MDRDKRWERVVQAYDLITQGKAEFTMEFSRYMPMPNALADELIKKHREEQAKKNK